MINEKELYKNLDELSAAHEGEISDKWLFNADIHASIAHAGELFHAGILTRRESEKIINGLNTLLKRSGYDKNYLYDSSAKTIHDFIEKHLIQLVGEVGKKLQAGRNRNEQTLTALRIWTRAEIETISKNIRDLQIIFVRAGNAQKEALIPVFENRKNIKPILWAHFCLMYFEIFARDRERLDEVWRRTNILPHGAENYFELSGEEIAAELGFEGISTNSLDAATDLDFAFEAAGILTIITVHLSRLSSDLIFNADENRRFIEFNKNFKIENHTKSKILSVLENVKLNTAKITGNQNTINVLQNGVLTNNTNKIGEIRKLIFSSIDILKINLEVIKNICEHIQISNDKTKEFIEKFFVNADGITVYLVNQGVPFRIAEEISAEIVVFAKSENKKLGELKFEEFQSFSDSFKADILEFLSVENILQRKNQIGGTSPERVYEALEMAKIDLDREEKN